MKTKHKFGEGLGGNRPAAGTKVLRSLVLCAVCLVVVATVSYGAKKKEKASRVVTGSVVDGSDNPIEGAIVEMTDERTGKKLAMVTQQDGHYQFSGLDEDHDYKLQATFKGITSDVRTASSFDTRNRIVLNFQIPPPED
jgi:Carboxypeptidase regulatory-like domain